MDIFKYLKNGIEKNMNKKLNNNQLSIIRNIAIEYESELKDNLDIDIEELTLRLKSGGHI